MVSLSIAGKRVLVTDTLHFAGPGLVPILSDLGAKLVAHDDDFADADLRAKFEKSHPGVKTLATTDPAALAAEATDHLGGIDVLINNDAFPASKIPIEEVTGEDIRGALERLVVRGMLLAGAVAPHMKAQGSGRIIFLTSAGPIGGIPAYSVYAAARSAANGMIKSLSMELAPHGISVNAVAPNYLSNPDYYPPELMAKPGVAERILGRIPLGRLGEQSECAALIAFLAGDHSGFVTGQVIPFAGGWV